MVSEATVFQKIAPIYLEIGVRFETPDPKDKAWCIIEVFRYCTAASFLFLF